MITIENGSQLRSYILTKAKKKLDEADNLIFKTDALMRKEISSLLFDSIKDDISAVLECKKKQSTTHHKSGSNHVQYNSSSNVESFYENGSLKCTYKKGHFIKYKKSDNTILFDISMNENDKMHGLVKVFKEDIVYNLDFDNGAQKGKITKSKSSQTIFEIFSSNKYKIDGDVKFSKKTMTYKNGVVKKLDIDGVSTIEKNSFGKISYIKNGENFKLENNTYHFTDNVLVANETFCHFIDKNEVFENMELSSNFFLSETVGIFLPVNICINQNKFIDINFLDSQQLLNSDILKDLNYDDKK